MKLFSTIFFFFIPLVTFLQNYSPAKPQLIVSNAQESSFDSLKLAWFYPGEKMLVAQKFEKMEIGISLPRSLEEKIQAFFNESVRADVKFNPFNRHDISIEVEFLKNERSIHVSHGFYYQEYFKDLEHNTWITDTTNYNFRVRFAPPETGNYTARVVINVKNSEPISCSFDFIVEDSSNPGFLEKGENGKHMRFSGSQESFVGVGQDIPWPVWEDWAHMDKPIGPKNVEETYMALAAFEKAGGNYTRFVASPWFLQLEWEALGNYLPRLNHAWELDRISEYCEVNDIYYMFCALLHTPLQSRTDAEDGLFPGVRWETYCYNDRDLFPAEIAHERPIGISKVIEYYSNPIANDHTKNYFRYLVSRYGYSTSLAGWQLMSEIDETAEYRDLEKQGNSVDRSENRTHIRNWVNALSTYMREDLKDQHLTSVAIIGGIGYSKTLWDPELYNLKYMDFFGFHDYMFETKPSEGKTRNRNILLRYSSVNELNIGFQNGSISFPDYQNKMFIYDEFGHYLAIPKPEKVDDAEDPTVDFNNCADFMFKQDLWFTFSSGCAVAGLDWWNQGKSPRHEMWSRYFPGILKFTSSIDFEKVNYTEVVEVKEKQMIAQRWPLTDKEVNRSNNRPYKKDDLLEAYTQVASTKDQAFGWMSNRSVHWYNMKDIYPCLNSLVNGTDPYAIPYLYEPKDDDIPDKPLDIDEGSHFIKVYSLLKRKDYEIHFYNTLTGEKIATYSDKTNGKGTLKVSSPKMTVSENPDVAYKIVLSGTVWR
jgi:hypothetical protein